MHGRIEAVNHPDGGAPFSVWLPLASTADARPEATGTVVEEPVSR